jgi:predicted lipid-binding transport protein (Tim44 family)
MQPRVFILLPELEMWKIRTTFRVRILFLINGVFMKFMSTLAIAAVSFALAFSSINAEAAKRMGGGKSMGQQSQNVTNKQAAPQNAATPAQAAKPAAAPAAPAPAPKKPWGAMLGGLAAGLGLAWLANSMGLGGALGGAMGNILTMLLMGVAAFMAWNMYKRYKANQQGGQNTQAAYANGYNPNNVGNDAAARPFENTTYQRTNTNFEAPQAAPVQTGSMIGSGIGAVAEPVSALSGSQTWGIPAGFDTVGFLAGAKAHFVNLQAAWDKSDVATLRSMLTEDMMREIQAQITERDTTSPAGTVHRTEVVAIEAHLMGIEEVPAGVHAAQYMASVEFSGQIREEVGLAAEPFREVWNLTKPVAGGGWLVAGIQALG